MKGKSALTLLLAGIFSCGTCQATGAEVTSESVFNILNSTGAATDKSYLSLNPDKYWICPYISRHLLSLNPLLARCRRYSRGER
ncbi:hypothetical protein CR535_04860 [Escherichia coli]|nr:hypothetical protein CR535_04860 [Escherichia coli]